MSDGISETDPKQVTLTKADVKKGTEIHKNFSMLTPSEPSATLGQGHEGKVSRVSIPVGESHSPVELAYKHYATEEAALHAFEMWKKLKAADVPVPPTFRLVQEDGKNTGVVMTDLTNGWQDILITSNRTKIHIISEVYKHSPSTVEKFRYLDGYDPEIRKSLEQQMKSIAEKTSANHIKLGDMDSISAVYSQTGELRLIISDMGSVATDTKSSPKDLYKYNYDTTTAIYEYLESARRVASYIAR